MVMPALDALMKMRIDQQISHLADTLAAGFAPVARSPEVLRAAVALALDLWTWRRLSQEGLPDDGAVDLMLRAVTAASGVSGHA